MADPETVQIELNSEKSEKNVQGGHHHSHEKLEKQLKIFRILTVVGFLLALIFLIVMIAVAATEEEKEKIIDNSKNYNYWEQILPEGAIPDIRLAHGSAVYNGELLVFYGMSGNDTDDTILADIWSYSPDHKTWTKWTTTGTAPSGRFHFASTISNDYLYMHGGFLNFEGEEESTDTFFKLNLKTKEWETIDQSKLTNKPLKRGAHEIIAYNDLLYIFGGSAKISGELYDDLWSYNIASKEWTEIAPKSATDAWPNARLGFNFYLNDNKFWLFAGTCDVAETNCSAGQSNDLWQFNPTNSIWQQLFPTGNIPQARRATHSEVTISKHTFLIGGVYIGTTATMMNDVHVYDIDTNRWIELHPEWPDEATTKIMSVRFGHIVEEIKNKLYVFGGRCGTPKVAGCNDLWVYTPPAFATEED